MSLRRCCLPSDDESQEPVDTLNEEEEDDEMNAGALCDDDFPLLLFERR